MYTIYDGIDPDTDREIYRFMTLHSFGSRIRHVKKSIMWEGGI